MYDDSENKEELEEGKDGEASGAGPINRAGSGSEVSEGDLSGRAREDLEKLERRYKEHPSDFLTGETTDDNKDDVFHHKMPGEKDKGSPTGDGEGETDSS